MNDSVLDHPEILTAVFHPRREEGPARDNPNATDHLIEVEAGVHVGARFHMASEKSANLIYFHGNGEIVADYDQLAPIYNNLGINLLAVDYRGYGRSTGSPSISAMMADCHCIFRFTCDWLSNRGYNGPLVVMGRSLGSASALELAAAYGDEINALIIESGFAFTMPLLILLGVDPERIGLAEKKIFDNLEKIKKYRGPTLIIHAEYDHIIPYSDGMALFKASTAQDKSLLKIENANHNDIFFRGMDTYMQAIQRLVSRLRVSRK